MNYNESVELLRKSFSAILKAKIAEYGYTKKEAAEKCCISERQITNLEKGNSLPKFITLVNIIYEFNIDFNQFMASVIDQGYKPLDEEK